MGAFVAVLLAARAPDRVSDLILIDGGVPLRLPANVTREAISLDVLGPAAARLSMTFADHGAYRDFWRAHPDIQIAFVPGPCLVPVDFDGFDFGIRVGKPADWPDFNCDPLISCRKVFVAAPELAASAAPQDLPWILSEGPHDLRFLAEAGVDVSRIELRNIGGEIFEVEAAKRGVGAILATEVVVRQALADGALVELDLHHPEPSVYNVITPKEPVREPVRIFLDWLKEALGAPQV